MKYCAFQNHGAELTIDTPFTPVTWDNRMVNVGLEAFVSQRLQGKVNAIERKFVQRSVFEEDRGFYLTVNGKPYQIARGTGSEFSCVHGVCDTTLTECFDGVRTKIHTFVPSEGRNMFWTISLCNKTERPVAVDFFSLFHFSVDWLMSYSSRFDKKANGMYCTGFPYYVKYEDHDKLQDQIRFKYVLCDSPVYAYEGNGQRFFGCDDHSVMPRAVVQGQCSNKCCELEPCYSIMQHRMNLAPGEETKISYVTGITETYEQMLEQKTSLEQIERIYADTAAFWNQRMQTFQVETPDENLNALINYWLKKQCITFVYTNRRNSYCCVRNQLQDLMGYSLMDPQDAFKRLVKILERQKYDGFLKQHYDTADAPLRDLGLMNHSDACMWLILCSVDILENLGDRAYYDYPVRYLDSPVQESVLTHLKKAAHYMFGQVGEHGLCLFLDGDWTDPVNGPGRLGKGESTWNSVALAHAVDKLNEVIFDPELDQKSRQIKEAVNRWCWDGNWYLAGFSDNGTPLGSHRDEECKIFLNSQTWAIISGVATGERLEKTCQSIERMLKADYGYLVLAPAFQSWNPIWGKISEKMAGTTENGSIYNHAVMFKAYADLVRGDGDMAVNTITMTLPTNQEHFPDDFCAHPLFYCNYYFGPGGDNYGRVNPYGITTGTVPWLLWLVVKQIFGVKLSSGETAFAPKLPNCWETAQLSIRRGDHIYTVRKEQGRYSCTVDGGEAEQ
ncbi:MAG: GH36-type glycosyl hydrolase domain-containing protein [Faecousia sp.]